MMTSVDIQQRDHTSTILYRLATGACFLGLVSIAERASLIRMSPVGVRGLIDPAANWLLWAAVAPLVLFAVRRIDRRAARVDRMMRHVLLAAVLMLCHSGALYVVQRTMVLTDLQVPVWEGALRLARWRLTLNLLAYFAILGVIRFSDAMRFARERELAAVRLSEQLSAAQLEALRLQLNPHFLFNALNTVAMLVRRGAGGDAVRAITRLGELLRELLRHDGSHLVTLRNELALLGRYLELERLRLGDRLRIVHEVEPDALDVLVPALVLQPIVENAIRHGISRSVSGGTLRLSARCDNRRLHLEVTDDGPGMAKHGSEPPGLGLANTVSRLSELYGDEFDVDIRSVPGCTVARLSIPLSPPRLATRRAS